MKSLGSSYWRIYTKRDKLNYRLLILCQCQEMQLIRKEGPKNRLSKSKSKLKKVEKEERESLKTH
jgi:hypothetical protein